MVDKAKETQWERNRRLGNEAVRIIAKHLEDPKSRATFFAVFQHGTVPHEICYRDNPTLAWNQLVELDCHNVMLSAMAEWRLTNVSSGTEWADIVKDVSTVLGLVGKVEDSIIPNDFTSDYLSPEEVTKIFDGNPWLLMLYFVGIGERYDEVCS